jgi:endonuclease/exonuclease/phosphatase (EEP) superfamily protein YafD
MPRLLSRNRRDGGRAPIGAGRRRIAVIAVAVLLLVVAFAGLLTHFLSFHSNPLLAVAAFSTYPMLAAPVALVLLLAVREWWVSGLALVVVGLCAALQIPLYLSQSAPADGARIVMMTANLRLGSADAAALVRLVREHHVDVLTVQELTPAEVERLKAAGLDSVLAHAQLDARGGGSGTGVYSRYAVEALPVPPGYQFAIVATRIDVPGLAAAPMVIGTHMPGPWPQNPSGWVTDIDNLPRTLRGFASGNPSASVLVGGDFNATTDTAQFRKLLTDGYRDAAGQAGAGHTRTFPADTWYPPLIAIDHVLTRNAVATSAKTLSVPGSDHRALLTTIVLSP